MALFKKGSGPFALHLSMSGIQMGERLLQVGCGDGRLFAALAGKVGLTGRACAVETTQEAVERTRQTAAREGVLVEVELAPIHRLPYEAESFDIVVIGDVLASMEPDDRVGCLKDVLRVLRPGGRCIVVERAERGGLGALFARQQKDPYYRSSGGAEGALRVEGFKAVRLLAERENVRFTEGMKGPT
jgi:ubiquinone/menaquinone biosynthesis C-methylase UbiE